MCRNATCDRDFNGSSSCSCHPACEIFNDCCYDTLDRFKDCPWREETETFMTEIFPSYQDYFQCTTDLISNNGSSRYWMVSKCPANWTGINKCDVIDDNNNVVIGRLEDNLGSVPLTSKRGLTFRNIYCAFCHGENLTELSPWFLDATDCDVNATIDFHQTNVSVKDKISLLNRHCRSLKFRPSQSNHPMHSVSLIPCHSVLKGDMIDSCDDATENELIAAKCSAVVGPVWVLGQRFKNTFCAQCYWSSKGRNIVVYEECKGAIQNPNTGGSNPSLVPISITFDFLPQLHRGVSPSVDRTNMLTTSITCDEGEVFDPFKHACVSLTCKEGFYLKDESCHVMPSFKRHPTYICDQTLLKIVSRTTDLISFNRSSCATNLERVSSCLPETLQSLILAVEEEYYDCHLTNNLTESNQSETTQVITSSLEIFERILSSINMDIPISSRTENCKHFDFLEISSRCLSKHNNFEVICDPHWLNESQWKINEENSSVQGVLISGELLDSSQIAIRYSLHFSDTNTIKHTTSLQKCHFLTSELSKCPLLALDRSVLTNQSENGSTVFVYLPDPSQKFSKGSYLELNDGSIKVCNFLDKTGFSFLPRFSKFQVILSTVGISLSLIALVVTLLTYCLFSKLRKRRASFLIMILCGCLIVAQLLLLLAGVSSHSSALCSAVSGLGHFFWLSVFSCTSVLGVTMVQTFSINPSSKRSERVSKKYICKLLFVCIGIPLAITFSLFLVYQVDGNQLDITYGSSGGCWIGGTRVNLYAFGVPVAVSLGMNCICFTCVSVSICLQKRRSIQIRKTRDENQLRELLIYTKVSFI